MNRIDLDQRRSIIHRRAIAERLRALSGGKRMTGEASIILREALDCGRAEVARRLAEEPGNGRAAARATAFLHDQLVRLAYDFASTRLLDQPAGLPNYALDMTPGETDPATGSRVYDEERSIAAVEAGYDVIVIPGETPTQEEIEEEEELTDGE